ncbi:MAG: DUF1028 domain-containing protein [Kofleriaceae bacterium]
MAVAAFKRRVVVGTIATVFLMFPLAPAHATWSIVGVDTETQAIGGAVATCQFYSLSGLIGTVPGRGVMVTQAHLRYASLATGVQLLAQGSSPGAVITAVTSPAYDAGWNERQHGVVTLDGVAAGFTGTHPDEVPQTRGDVQGVDDWFAYSIQGNILTPNVLTQTQAATHAGCDLPERLMNALEAGAAGGEGDWRCTKVVPAAAAFIQVDVPGVPKGEYLKLDVFLPLDGNMVEVHEEDNAVVKLRALFDEWRLTHPCPAPPEPPDDGEPDAMDGTGGCAAAPGALGAMVPLALMVAGVAARRRYRSRRT